jgi:integrase
MLTDVAIRKLKPGEIRYMVRDDQGLYLEVMPTGRKVWRIRVWVEGKEVKRTLGKYPAVTLAQARSKRDEIQQEIDAGQNPFQNRPADTFEAVAREWLEKKVLPIRAPAHVETIVSRLTRFVFPALGPRQIATIQPADVLSLIRKIEAAGIHETAHRTLQICGQVFRYGVATGRCPRDVSADLRGALVPVLKKHHATITEPSKIGGLVRAIDGFDGSLIVRSALKLGLLTFVRPGELRRAEWAEIDLEKAEWRIQPEKMKMRRLHIVPLSSQAVESLEAIRIYTGDGRFVFPCLRTPDRPISENTVNAALRRMGYEKDEMTGHGFRSMASTILNENGWPADAIERQLAHVDGNSVRAAYNYAEHLDKRREMMQWWADWLEEQKQG